MSRPGPLPRTRPPLARMLKIHEALQDGHWPNCIKLAGALEVSVKTVQRDIEFMRDRLNLPIAYDGPRHGYFYAEPVSAFPSIKVSEGEILALVVAQKALEQYRGTPFEGTLRTAFEKIITGLDNEVTFQSAPGVSFRTAGVGEADLEQYSRLHHAVRAQQEVSFDYHKVGARRSEPRRVRPHHLACVQGAWYVVAWDLRREAMRTFALARIKKVRLLERRFERVQGFSIDNYFGNSFGVFTGDGVIPVKIRFDEFAARYIRERIWHHSQSLRELARGQVELRLQVADLHEVGHWALSWGEHAEVVAPAELRRSLRQSIEALGRIYRVER